MREAVIIYTTFPTLEEAQTISSQLVEDKYVACVNLFPKMIAIYEWEGQINQDTEVAAFFKTDIRKADSLMKEIKKHHSYELPALVQLPINGGDDDYLKWISSTIKA